MFLKKLVKKLIYGPFEPGIHYSQSGEDLNVFAIIKSIILLNNGFFIDVGSLPSTVWFQHQSST
jgi:hypothetical protein